MSPSSSVNTYPGKGAGTRSNSKKLEGDSADGSDSGLSTRGGTDSAALSAREGPRPTVSGFHGKPAHAASGGWREVSRRPHGGWGMERDVDAVAPQARRRSEPLTGKCAFSLQGTLWPRPRDRRVGPRGGGGAQGRAGPGVGRPGRGDLEHLRLSSSLPRRAAGGPAPRGRAHPEQVSLQPGAGSGPRFLTSTGEQQIPGRCEVLFVARGACRGDRAEDSKSWENEHFISLVRGSVSAGR